MDREKFALNFPHDVYERAFDQARNHLLLNYRRIESEKRSDNYLNVIEYG